MDRDDTNIPEDLTEVADRLRAARTEPTPLELDGMWQTVRRRTAGGASRTRALKLRGHLVAMLLTVGLVFTTGASAVVASTYLSSGGSTSYSGSWSQPKDASYCQYRPPYTKTFTLYSSYSKTVTVTVTADCYKKTVCLTVKRTGSGSSSKTACATFDRETGYVTIKCDGQTYSFPVPKD